MLLTRSLIAVTTSAKLIPAAKISTIVGAPIVSMLPAIEKIKNERMKSQKIPEENANLFSWVPHILIAEIISENLFYKTHKSIQ